MNRHYGALVLVASSLGAVGCSTKSSAAADSGVRSSTPGSDDDASDRALGSPSEPDERDSGASGSSSPTGSQPTTPDPTSKSETESEGDSAAPVGSIDTEAEDENTVADDTSIQGSPDHAPAEESPDEMDAGPPSHSDAAAPEALPNDPTPPEDATQAPPESVPMFVAAGAGGRRVTSCDDGQTWIAEEVLQPDFDDYDHHEWIVRGLSYGEGTFVSFHGWGYDGHMLRTVDGVQWDEVYPVGEQSFPNGFWGAAYGNGNFVGVGSAAFIRSTDGGRTWSGPDWLNVDDGHTLIAYGDDTFVTIQPGQSVRSQTGGASWEAPVEFDCPVDAIAYGGGIFLTHGFDGSTCRSENAGESWSAAGNTRVGGEAGAILWNGDEFIALGETLSRSPDGAEWTPAGTVGLSAALDVALSSETGTLIATAVGPTRLARSVDGGTTWEATLSGDPFFRQIEFGYGLPSAQCPAR